MHIKYFLFLIFAHSVQCNNFKPLHINFDLWNAGPENHQAEKSDISYDSTTNAHDNGTVSVFWTVTSKVGSGDGEDDAPVISTSTTENILQQDNLQQSYQHVEVVPNGNGINKTLNDENAVENLETVTAANDTYDEKRLWQKLDQLQQYISKRAYHSLSNETFLSEVNPNSSENDTMEENVEISMSDKHNTMIVNKDINNNNSTADEMETALLAAINESNSALSDDNEAIFDEPIEANQTYYSNAREDKSKDISDVSSSSNDVSGQNSLNKHTGYKKQEDDFTDFGDITVEIVKLPGFIQEFTGREPADNVTSTTESNRRSLDAHPSKGTQTNEIFDPQKEKSDLGTTESPDKFGTINSTWSFNSTSAVSTSTVGPEVTNEKENVLTTEAVVNLTEATTESIAEFTTMLDEILLTTNDNVTDAYEDFNFTSADLEQTTFQTTVSTDSPASAVPEVDNGNVVKLLKTLKLNILLDLLLRTKLYEELARPDQRLTLFAPTDEAFNSLAPSTIRRFQSDRNLLRNLVLHHIVDELVLASNFFNERQVKSLALATDGEPVPLTLNLYDKKGASVDGARFILADIQGTNGIIHVINKVLYRNANTDVLSTLRKCSAFSTLMSLADKAQIYFPGRPNSFTVFAPVNEAWETEDLTNLTATQAKDLFMSHVVEGSRYSSGLADGEEIDTKHNFHTIKVEVRNGELKEVQRARVIVSDIPATNGVIHIIDRTLHESKLCQHFF